jgi:hypothetical protein
MLSSGTSTTASPLPAPPKPDGSAGRIPYCCLPPRPFCKSSDGSSVTPLTHSRSTKHSPGRQPNFRARGESFWTHGVGAVVGVALVEGVGVVMHARRLRFSARRRDGGSGAGRVVVQRLFGLEVASSSRRSNSSALFFRSRCAARRCFSRERGGSGIGTDRRTAVRSISNTRRRGAHHEDGPSAHCTFSAWTNFSNPASLSPRV